MDASKTKLATVIVEGLRTKPAYLLIFGICALLFMFSFGAGAVALAAGNPQWMYVASFCFVVALISAVAVVRVVEKNQKQIVAPPPVPAGPPLTIGHPGFDDVLKAINTGLREALSIDNDIFRQAMLDECHSFQAKVGVWSDGQFQAHDAQYNEILLQLYAHARESVFSTTIPNYLPTWTTPLGRQITEAHAKSRALVTRVFVFNSRNEVTAQAIEEMEKQDRLGNIKVRLYFDEEDKTFNFPPDVSRDFTVIDKGEAIGITVSFGEGSTAAVWYIKDQNKRQRFLHICEALERGSIPFRDFKK
jgi:hypothetical protein